MQSSMRPVSASASCLSSDSCGKKDPEMRHDAHYQRGSLAEIAERRAVAQDDSLAQLEAECRGSQVDPEFRVTWSFIPSLKKPVIAAVNGPCAGMSTAIATMCDLRFASDSAVFTTSFSQRGLVAEHGLSWILLRLIGPAKALDLLWSARPPFRGSKGAGCVGARLVQRQRIPQAHSGDSGTHSRMADRSA